MPQHADTAERQHTGVHSTLRNLSKPVTHLNWLFWTDFISAWFGLPTHSEWVDFCPDFLFFSPKLFMSSCLIVVSTSCILLFQSRCCTDLHRYSFLTSLSLCGFCDSCLAVCPSPPLYALATRSLYREFTVSVSLTHTSFPFKVLFFLFSTVGLEPFFRVVKVHVVCKTPK